MNFIGRHLNAIGLTLLIGFTAAAAGLYLDVPGQIQKARQTRQLAARFTCPMHPKVVSDKAGDCPDCGMKLVAQSSVAAKDAGCGGHQKGCCATGSASPHSGCSH